MNISVEELVVQAARPGHLVNGLKVQRQVGIVDGIVLGAVIDVGDLADVILLLLLVMEGLQQLAPPVKHEQQPLIAAWHAPLHKLSHNGAATDDQHNYAGACLILVWQHDCVLPSCWYDGGVLMLQSFFQQGFMY